MIFLTHPLLLARIRSIVLPSSPLCFSWVSLGRQVHPRLVIIGTIIIMLCSSGSLILFSCVPTDNHIISYSPATVLVKGLVTPAQCPDSILKKPGNTTTLGNLLPFGATDSSPTSPVITDAHFSKDDGDQKKKAPSTHEEEQGKQLCSSGIFLFCFRVCRPISCSCTATGGAMKDPPLKKVEETTETLNQPGDICQLFKSPQSPLGNESTRPSTKTEEKDDEAEGDATQGSKGKRFLSSVCTNSNTANSAVLFTFCSYLQFVNRRCRKRRCV